MKEWGVVSNAATSQFPNEIPASGVDVGSSDCQEFSIGLENTKLASYMYNLELAVRYAVILSQ